MRILFRCDASTIIGIGHVRRCLTLARRLAGADADIRFATRSRDIDSIALLSEFANCAHALSPARMPCLAENYISWLGVSEAEDAVEVLAGLDGWVPDWIIVDHYALGSVWHGAMRAARGSCILAIDDLANRMLAADLILDQNWHADHTTKYASVNQRHAPILGGPAYAMLDAAFAAGPRYTPRREVRSIGIFMGGSDASNTTSVVLDAISVSRFEGRVSIATSSTNPNLKALQSRVAEEAQIDMQLDLPNLAVFFASHDLAVGAGGSATWERFCIGVPSLLLSFADNHDSVLLPMTTLGAARILTSGWTTVDLVSALADFATDAAARAICSAQGKKLVDGRGTGRIAAKLCEMR